VQNEARVQLDERCGHLPRQGHRLLDGQPGALEAGDELLAVEPLHDQIRRPFARDAVGDVAYHPRVAHAFEQARFAGEPRDVRGPQEHLHGRRLPGREVERAVHRAHSPLAGQALQLEPVSEDRARLHSLSVHRNVRPNSTFVSQLTVPRTRAKRQLPNAELMGSHAARLRRVLDQPRCRRYPIHVMPPLAALSASDGGSSGL
jgi:hypothetical protein